MHRGLYYPSESLYSKCVSLCMAGLCSVSPQTGTEVTCQTKMCISSISSWHIIHCAVLLLSDALRAALSSASSVRTTQTNKTLYVPCSSETYLRLLMLIFRYAKYDPLQHKISCQICDLHPFVTSKSKWCLKPRSISGCDCAHHLDYTW